MLRMLAAIGGALLFMQDMEVRASTITVNSLADENPLITNGNCTLREAITAANDDTMVDGCPAGSSGADTIKFSVVGTIQLLADLPQVSDSLSVIGPGANLLTISGANPSQGLPYFYQLFNLNGSSTPKNYSFKGVTLRGGYAHGGGTSDYGGCIKIILSANLTLDHVRVTECYATGVGGGVYIGPSASIADVDIKWSEIDQNEAGGRGGGIAILGAVHFTMENSAVISNITHSLGYGGGISIAAIGSTSTFLSGTTAMVNRSTVAGNVASGVGGGGLFFRSNSGESIDVEIGNSTINGNISGADYGVANTGEGAGVHAAGGDLSLDLKNSIVAGNLDMSGTPASPPHDDLYLPVSNPPTPTTGGFNFIGSVTGSLSTGPFSSPGLPTGNDDFIGSYPTGLNPQLGALDYNGGPTRSLVPSSTGSPVVDQGKCTQAFDQRGYGSASNQRIVDVFSVGNYVNGNGCDIGAVEFAGASVSDYDSDGVVDDSDAFPLDSGETTDSDNDNIGDNSDNCPTAFNPGQEDQNGYEDSIGEGDACEPDQTMCFPVRNQHGGMAVICL